MRTDSLISPGLFKSYLKHFWPLWAVYLVVWLVVFVAPLYSLLGARIGMAETPDDVYNIMQALWELMKAVTGVCIVVAGAVVAVSLNDRLFDAKAATFAGSLPLRRRTVFATNYLAGFLAQVGVILVVFAVLLVVRLVVPELRMVMVGQWLALALALTFVFYSLAQLVCQICGTRPVAVVLYGVVNLLAVCFEAAVRLTVGAFQYGLSDWGWGLSFSWLAPAVGVFQYGIYGNAAPYGVGWPGVVGYCVAAIAFVAVAALLNGRRHMEMAGEAIAWPRLRPVLKYLAGVSGGLLFAAIAVLLYWSEDVPGLAVSAGRAVWLTVLMVAGSAIALVVAEMVMSRTTRVFKSCAKGAFVLTCIAVGFSVALCSDAFGVASRIPAADQVEKVRIQDDGALAAELASDDGIQRARQLHADILAYGAQAETGALGQTDIVIAYTMRDGSELRRSYTVLFDFEEYISDDPKPDAAFQVLDELTAIGNSSEARLSRYGEFFGADAQNYTVEIEYGTTSNEESTTITLPKKDAAAFINDVLQPDLMDHSAGDFWVYTHENSGEYDACVRLLNDRGEIPLWLWLSDESTPSCVKWIHEHYPNVKLRPA